MIDRIQRQMEILYWNCGCRHDVKSSDVFGLGMETCDVVREEIEDCIQLLNVSGKNTKKQVQDKLKMLIGGKPKFEIETYDSKDAMKLYEEIKDKINESD